MVVRRESLKAGPKCFLFALSIDLDFFLGFSAILPRVRKIVVVIYGLALFYER